MPSIILTPLGLIGRAGFQVETAGVAADELPGAIDVMAEFGRQVAQHRIFGVARDDLLAVLQHLETVLQAGLAGRGWL